MEQNQGFQSESGFIYEVYAYRKDPETKLSPWLRISRDEEMLDAREKAYKLYKAKLYDRIEIQQKPAGNANERSAKVIKTYNKGFCVEKMKKIFPFL